MDRRIALLVIAPLLGILLLSSCGGAQVATSPTALPTTPAQPGATAGALPTTHPAPPATVAAIASTSAPPTAAPALAQPTTASTSAPPTAAPALAPTAVAPARTTAAPRPTARPAPLATAVLVATTAPAPPTAVPALPTAAPVATPEQAVAPEQNPAGDIPDTQAFVPYSATPGGYTLDVPEGWARSTDAANVRFESKLDGLSVVITAATAAPTAARARDHEVAALIAAGRAMTVTSVDDVTLPVGSAVLIKSTANSNPDTVTNKQVRIEQNIYLFFNHGKLATLTLWAPLGADNIDQWQRIATSFHWA